MILNVVNPARAGMIPRDAALRGDGSGKPRASGDDPFVLCTICLDTA